MMFKTSLSAAEPSIRTSFVLIVAVMPLTVSLPSVKRNSDVKEPFSAIVPEATSFSGVRSNVDGVGVVVVVVVVVTSVVEVELSSRATSC